MGGVAEASTGQELDSDSSPNVSTSPTDFDERGPCQIETQVTLGGDDGLCAGVYDDHWSADLAEPLTRWLEMTALNDPASLREGKKLRLRVSFDGRPVEGVVVSYDGKPRGTTGRDGRINIRVRHGGFQVIQASLTLPDASGKADEVVHSANLNFELPEE